MSGAWGLIAAGVVGVIGYVVGRSGAKQTIATAQHDFKIKITKDAQGNYKGDTDIKSKNVQGSDRVVWKVKDEGSNALPAGSVVFLRFPGGSPLFSDEPDDGGKRTIVSHVVFGQPLKEYHYQVYYRHNGAEHVLEDPKLIMEGNRTIVVVD